MDTFPRIRYTKIKSIGGYHEMKKIRLSWVHLVLLALVLLVSACQSEAQTPSEGLEDTLKAFQEQDMPKIKALTGGHEGFDLEAFKNTFSEKNRTSSESFGDVVLDKVCAFTYTLGDEHIDGERATVQVDVTYIDLAQALTSALAKTEPMEANQTVDVAQITQDLKMASDTLNETFSVKMIKDGEQWVIDPDNNAAMMNVLTGNLANY